MAYPQGSLPLIVLQNQLFHFEYELKYIPKIFAPPHLQLNINFPVGPSGEKQLFTTIAVSQHILASIMDLSFLPSRNFQTEVLSSVKMQKFEKGGVQ